MSSKEQILFPVGRLVGGSLYEGQTEDAEGKPLVVKSGANAGQPRTDYYFLVAIPKEPGHTHWAQTAWGQTLWAVGHKDFPQAAQSPQFAWKVKDGDSTVPNRKGKAPNTITGAPGHWLVSFSSGFPPKICSEDGSQPITEVDAVKPGDYIQVFGSVGGNGSQQQPGVFINHTAVAFAGYGERINLGIDTSKVGFGQGPKPAGASAVPLGAMVPPAVMAPPPVAAPAPVMAPPQVAAPAPVAAPTVVQPNTTFMAPPPPAAAAPVAPPPAAKVLTAKAGGATYESFIQAGWTDETLRQHGYLA